MKKHETVDQFIAAANQGRAELAALRSIVRATGLEETVKWGSPVWTESRRSCR